MPIPSILVAVDFSPESDVAIRHAMALGRKQGAEVVLTHAGTVLDAPVGDHELASLAAYRTIVEDETRANRARLEDVRARLEGQGVEVSHSVVDGFPDTTIPRIAEEIGAGTIVLGTHGRTGLKWFLLGSVAQRIVRLARTNVLVARGDAPAGGYRRICVAIDFSSSADPALSAALSVAAADARIDVVNCWFVTPTLGLAGNLGLAQSLMLENRAAIEQAFTAQGEKLIARFRRPGLTIGFRSVFAEARRGIVEHLEADSFDLVVLGSHGRRGVRRFVLGSVAEAVAARAPCSALVAHGD